MKIKELQPDKSLTGIRFYDPKTGTVGYWHSQWGYPPPGKAGVWYKVKLTDSQVHPLFLDQLQEAIEFEVVSDVFKPPKRKRKLPVAPNPSADWIKEMEGE